MSTSIVVGTDLGQSGAHAADVGAELARALDVGLVLVHAVCAPAAVDPAIEPGSRAGVETLAARLSERYDSAHTALLAEKARLETNGARHVIARLVEGRPSEAVIQEAKAVGARYVVVGPHQSVGRVRDRILGSTADAVLRHAPCPVIVAT